MPPRRTALMAAAALPLGTSGTSGASAAAPAWPDAAEIALRTEQLRATEVAFAATMAARDLAAFQAFLAPDTVWTGGRAPLIGPEAVVAGWRAYFDGPTPPFSWAPDTALVLPSGELGRTAGPVHGPDGKLLLRFNSVWRRLAQGRWEIVFDYATPAGAA